MHPLPKQPARSEWRVPGGPRCFLISGPLTCDRNPHRANVSKWRILRWYRGGPGKPWRSGNQASLWLSSVPLSFSLCFSSAHSWKHGAAPLHPHYPKSSWPLSLSLLPKIEYLVPPPGPKLICWKPNAQVMVLGGGVYGKWLSREVTALTYGISALIKEASERCLLSSSHVSMQWEGLGTYDCIPLS